MPNIHDLIAEMTEAGVSIDNQDAAVKLLEAADDWKEQLVFLGRVGRKLGMSLTRQTADAPSDEKLRRIFDGYNFSENQKSALVRLINVAVPGAVRHDIEVDEYYKPGAPGSLAHLFGRDVDLDEVLREKFSSGQGVVALTPGMPDAAVLAVIKMAVSASNGQPFTVIKAPASSKGV